MCWCVGVCVCCVLCGPPSLRRTALRRTAISPDRPSASLPKISRFFPLSRFHFRSFSIFLWGSLRGVFSWNFGGVFEGRGAQMCTFGLSGCRVKPRRLWGRRASHDNPRTPNDQKTPRKRDKKKKWRRNRKKKKREIFGPPHPSGFPTLREPTFSGSQSPQPHPRRLLSPFFLHLVPCFFCPVCHFFSCPECCFFWSRLFFFLS